MGVKNIGISVWFTGEKWWFWGYIYRSSQFDLGSV